LSVSNFYYNFKLFLGETWLLTISNLLTAGLTAWMCWTLLTYCEVIDCGDFIYCVFGLFLCFLGDCLFGPTLLYIIVTALGECLDFGDNFVCDKLLSFVCWWILSMMIASVLFPCLFIGFFKLSSYFNLVKERFFPFYCSMILAALGPKNFYGLALIKAW
jgi:hypothetical protein